MGSETLPARWKRPTDPVGNRNRGRRVQRPRFWCLCKYVPLGLSCFPSQPQFPHLLLALHPANLMVCGERILLTDVESLGREKKMQRNILSVHLKLT